MSATDDDTAFRTKLQRAGFQPLPLFGKRPAMDQWSQKFNVTDAEIKLWQQLYPWSENTGILTKDTPTIDIDILIPEAAEAIEELVRDMFLEKGRILVRTGRAPKRAIPLRTDDPFKKLMTTLLGPDGKPSLNKVEILCDGQQVAVHGIHPDTKKPYDWFGGEPGDISRDQLPYIHAEEAADFIKRCCELLVAEFGFFYPPKSEALPGQKGNGAAEFHHADWTALVTNILAGAELHDSIRDLAASFAANDVLPDTASRILQSLMMASTLPHDDRWRERFAEITRAVISGYEKFKSGTTKPIVLKFIDMSSWDDVRAPDRAWAVPDRIPVRQATLLSGEGSVGKTILELQLCVAHTLGLDWLGSLPEKGPVIYFGAEDDNDELHRRLQSIVNYYDAQQQQAQGQHVKYRDLIDNGLHLLSFAGEDCLLGVPNRSGQIVPTPLYERLLKAVTEIKPKHVGIDTSADVFGGIEIDRAQVRQFIGLLRRLAIACNGSVVLLAHPSLEGIRSGSGLSGSTGWHNSVRARMYFKPATEKKADDDDEAAPDSGLRELRFMKNNYGPIASTIKLEYRNGVFTPLASIKPIDQQARELRADEVFMSAFRDLLERGGIFSPSSSSPKNYAPKAVEKIPAAKAFKYRELEEAMERLIASGKLLKEPYTTAQRKKAWRLVIEPTPESQKALFEDTDKLWNEDASDG